MSHVPPKHVALKRGLSGLGLFASQAIKRGEFIIEYTGEKISTEEANRRGGRYLFTLNDTWTLDAKDRTHTARYMNHSCKPNCYAELDEDTLQIFIYSKRSIKAGEELTYHYGTEYKEQIIGDSCRCPACYKINRASSSS